MKKLSEILQDPNMSEQDKDEAKTLIFNIIDVYEKALNLIEQKSADDIFTDAVSKVLDENESLIERIENFLSDK
jgi:hypothetical protein